MVDADLIVKSLKAATAHLQKQYPHDIKGDSQIMLFNKENKRFTCTAEDPDAEHIKEMRRFHKLQIQHAMCSVDTKFLVSKEQVENFGIASKGINP